MKETSVELELSGKKITFETGELAIQATSSILARMGDTMILATVTEGKLREDIDYFPLSVEYVVNPGNAESEFSELDLIATQTKEKTLMLEAGSNQISEDKILEAIKKAHEENKKIIEFIEKLTKEIGVKKEVVNFDQKFEEAKKLIQKSYKEEAVALLKERLSKESNGNGAGDLVDEIFEREQST